MSLISMPACLDARASTSAFAPASCAATSPNPSSFAVALPMIRSRSKKSAMTRPISMLPSPVATTSPAVATAPNCAIDLPDAAARSSKPRISRPRLMPTDASTPSKLRSAPPSVLICGIAVPEDVPTWRTDSASR